jgi:hypothetical protein
MVKRDRKYPRESDSLHVDAFDEPARANLARRLNMRTSLIVASLGATMTTLVAGIAPAASAEPVANAYPYCRLGVGGGSTTCYFRSRAECGSSCVDNLAYVGDRRAREILANTGLTLEVNRTNRGAINARNSPTATRTIGSIEPGARASARRGDRSGR